MSIDYNLKEKSDFIRSEFSGNESDINKLIARNFRDSRSAAKLDKCYYCGKNCTSFCNSHSIPAFCLKNISNHGEVLTANSIIDFPFYLKKSRGVGNAGTFQIICHQCDNTLFQDYENPDAYESIPTPQMLSQIALKIVLKNISKRLLETEIYKNIQNISKNEEQIEYAADTNKINDLDMTDNIIDFNKAKKAIEKDDNSAYYLIYHNLLNYTAPLAFQGSIALYVDFNGQIVNNIYNRDPNYHIKNLYVCVFPLNGKTAVVVFIDNNEKRFRRFYKPFMKLSREEKLSVINFMILAYSEDFYFSEAIKNKFDDKTKSLVGHTSISGVSMLDIISGDPLSAQKELYNLKNHNKYPNFLSKEYGLNSN